MTAKKSTEEIEELKRCWYRDPIFDIEDTEGYEAHRKELLWFSTESKAHWKKLAQEKHDRLAAKICPMSMSYVHRNSDDTGFGFDTCQLEKCAWWDPDRELCGILPYAQVQISGGVSTHPY